MYFNPGTPSALRLSTKLLHSLTTNIHSANALPAYLACAAATPSGLVAKTSLAVPGMLSTRKACVGAGRRGGGSRGVRGGEEVAEPGLWLGGGNFEICSWDRCVWPGPNACVGGGVHSRENLKEKGRCVGVVGVESDREEELVDLGMIWRGGRERCDAVAWRACSRGVKGFCPGMRDVCGPWPGSSGLLGVLKGIILPRRLQRFFEPLGASGTSNSVDPERPSPAKEECRLYAVSCVLGLEDPSTLPSNPRKRFDVGIWLSFLIINRRRPGAGLHGAMEGGCIFSLSASSLW
jgi:hypothetical protein